MASQRSPAYSTTGVGALGLFAWPAIQDMPQWMATVIVISKKTTNDARLAWQQNQNLLFQPTTAGLARSNEKVFASNVRT